MTILVIDPQIKSSLQVRQVFAENGFQQLEITRSVNEARERLRSSTDATTGNALTLVIINCELDEGDGYQLCREIRQSELGRRVYIMLLISSAKNVRAIEKAKYYGADDYSVKPYRSAEFQRHLFAFAYRKAALLVEDDPTVCRVVASILNSRHVELVIRDHGTEAYNLINAMPPPRLVFLDIGLPGMNGLALIRHIRSKPPWRRTPVIMLTASTDAEDVRESRDAGANKYIVKPFEVKYFTEHVDHYFPGVQ